MADDPTADAETRSTEARIAHVLSESAARLATVPPYVRRHLCEHAAAGDCLDDRTIRLQILPFVDVSRLRAEVAGLTANPAGADSVAGSPMWTAMLALVRQVSHAWDWDHPRQNAAALQFWAAAGHVQLPGLDELSAWRVIWATSPGPGEIIGRAKSAITCVTTDADPSGAAVAVTGSRDGTLSIWNLTTGSVTHSRAWGSPIRALAIASYPLAQRTIIAGHADGSLRLWSRAGDRDQRPVLLKEHRGGAGVTALASVPIDQSPLALLGRQDGSLRLWDMRRDTLLPWLARQDDPVTGIATAQLTSDRLVALTVRLDGTLQIWELSGEGHRPRSVSRPMPGHAQAIAGVAVARLADERTVAVTAGDDGTVRVWDLESGRPLAEPLRTHDGAAVTAVATCRVAGEAWAVTIGRDHRLRTSQLPDGWLVDEQALDYELTAIATVTQADGRVLAVGAASDRSLRTWDLGSTMTAVGHAVPGSRPATGWTARHPTAVAAGAGGLLQTWLLADGRPLAGRGGRDPDGITGVAVGTRMDGQAVVITAHRHRRGSWDGSALTGSTRTTDVPLAVPEGSSLILTGHHDGSVRAWDLTQLTEVSNGLRAHTGPVISLAIGAAAERSLLLSGGLDGTLRLWPLAELLAVRAGSAVLEGSLGSELLSGSRGEPAHDGPVSVLAAISWHGQLIGVSGSNTTLQVWDLDNRARRSPPIQILTHPVTALALAEVNGRLMAVLGCERDGSAHVWELTDEPRKVWTLEAHERPVTAIAVAAVPDGPVVAFTASADLTIRAWDLALGAPIGDAVPLPGTPKALAGHSHAGRAGVIVGGGSILAGLELWPTT